MSWHTKYIISILIEKSYIFLSWCPKCLRTDKTFVNSHVIQSRNIITNYYFIDNFVPSAQSFVWFSHFLDRFNGFCSLYLIWTISKYIWTVIYKVYLHVQNRCFDLKSRHHDKKHELIRPILMARRKIKRWKAKDALSSETKKKKILWNVK